MSKLKIPFFSLVLLALAGCSLSLDIDPIVNFESNVLRPTVSFTTNDTTAVYIKYWKKGSQKKFSSDTSIGVKHTIQLLNLTEDTEYNYQIYSIDNKYKSIVSSFVTGKIPDDLFVVEKEKIDTNVFSGYILIRKFSGVGADIILNNEGDVVWYHNYNQDIRRQFSWTKSGTILSGVDTAHIVEIDLYGNQLFNVDLSKTDNPIFAHHEIVYDDNGDLVTLVTDSIVVNPESKANKRVAYTDGIVRLGKDGALLWKWNVVNHMDYEMAIKAMKSVKGRISHSNSLTIDGDGNYLISFRDFAQIWKVNSKTGEVLWKLGKGGDIEMDTTAYFIGQHSINYSGDKLIVFDNGNPRLRDFSRILSFSIDERTKKAKTEISIDLPKEITSYRMGSAYKIADNRFLVCTSVKTLTLSVVNEKGEILWKIGGNQNSFRAYYIENPFIKE